MTDIVATELFKTIGIGITAITSIILLVVNVKQKRKTEILSLEAAKLALEAARMNIKIDTNTSKVEEYHKEVNGKMGLLLDTTKELGEKIGKEKEQANPTK